MTIDKELTDISKENALRILVEGWVDMSVFSQQAISAVLSEISEIMAMQKDMAASISSHIRSIEDAGMDAVQRGHMDCVVASTQKEDHLRQRHEHLSAALAVVIDCLEHMKVESTAIVAGAEKDANGYSREWRQSLLEAQTLSEVRNKFAGFLNGGAADRKKSSERPLDQSGDIEYF